MLSITQQSKPKDGKSNTVTSNRGALCNCQEHQYNLLHFFDAHTYVFVTLYDLNRLNIGRQFSFSFLNYASNSVSVNKIHNLQKTILSSDA